MTISKTLARNEFPNGNTVTAYESYEKYAAAPHYEVVLSRADSPLVSYWDVHKCARTTWRKKFREVCDEAAR